MKIKTVVLFILAFAFSSLAANYRWGDSAHAIGLLNAKGGHVRHGAVLAGGKDDYTLIATAAVIPPYRGDVRVVLEGDPMPDYDLMLGGAVVDLGIRRTPKLHGDVIRDLRPRDRIALWVRMHMSERYELNHMPGTTGGQEADAHAGPRAGAYHLAFYDTRTNHRVMDVPVIFKHKEVTHEAPNCCQ